MQSPGRDSAPWGVRPLQRPCLSSGLPFGGDCPSNSFLEGAAGSTQRQRDVLHKPGLGSWLCCHLHTSLGSCCDHPWLCLSPAVTLLCLCVCFQHKYVSISDVQIKNEEELEKCPMSLVRRKLFHPITRKKMGGKSNPFSFLLHFPCFVSALGGRGSPRNPL